MADLSVTHCPFTTPFVIRYEKRPTRRVTPVISELCVKSMLSAGPPWQGSALQTLRNARAEFNLQKLADKMFRRQGEVRERRRYERLYELNYDKNLPRSRGDNNPINTIMRPRFNVFDRESPPGSGHVFAAMYPIDRSVIASPYAPGMSRMRDVTKRIIFRLRVWIRRTLRRLVCTRDAQFRFFLPHPRNPI
jgi:hypothetical protein